jgi:hypothetical protein
MRDEVVAADLRGEVPERLELSREVIVASLVGGSEVRHQADGVLPRRKAERELAVLRPEPPHTGVELHVHPRRGLGDPLGPGDNVGVGLDGGAELVAREGTHHEQAGLDPARAQLGRLAGGGYGQPSGTARQRRLRDLDHAVPVTVRLHHRAQRFREPAAVPLDRA